MTNTATITANLAYSDGSGDIELGNTEGLAVTLTNAGFTRIRQSVGTSEEAVTLGDATAPGYAVFINRDATNYIDLKVATGGAIFARLSAGGGLALLNLGSGAQAPFAAANTAACIMDILIVKT